MNFFNLSLQLSGFPIKEALQKLASIHSLNDELYEAYIEEQKKSIFFHHFVNTPFYKNFAPQVRDYNWESIPVMTKNDLQKSLSKRLSKGYSKRKCYINKTSGSSGKPFIFAKDKFCHALSWAIFMDRYKWYDVDLSSSKQARFYGIPLNKAGHYKERLKDVLSNRFRFSVFDLSKRAFIKNVRAFKDNPFHYINGYTSAIVQFAKYLKEENLILKSICPTLEVCIITSEMLFEDDRLLLEQQLGIPVINEYGAAELGLIAFQGIFSEWIINSEDLYVEILDDNNTPLPYGETGRIVVTSLYNKAHPFIRYELGDIGSLSKKSTLRKPILQSLQGRTSDVIKLPSGKTAAGLTFYYITKSIINDRANVKEFVIDQEKLDTFKITYVSDEELSYENTVAVKQAVEKYLEPYLTVIFERKDNIKRSKSGKLRQFTSHL